MPTADLRWELSLANVSSLADAGFDEWLVERGTGTPTVWAEITHATTRPPLNGSATLYVYADLMAPVDGDGDVDAEYRATPYRTSDGATDAPVAADAVRRGYITPDDVYDEGYAPASWPATTVWRGIDRATATIEAVCGQWFGPRYRRIARDGSDIDQIFLDVPICALHRLIQDDTEVDLSDLEVYNRHLTRAQLDPDDRRNPKVTYSLDFPPGYRGRRRRIYADAALFGAGRQNVILKGVWGFTEPSELAAETEDGSQIPVNYGKVPPEIARAALLLTLTYMMPVDEQQEAALEGRITGVKTRDQSISFASPPDSTAGYGMTGNVAVDNILMRYSRVMGIGAAG